MLIAAGAVIIVMSMARKPQTEQPVAMQDVFNQAPDQQTLSTPGVADPVRSPAIVTSPENGQEAGFAVQVYSFQDRIRADKALVSLKEAGYKAFMEVSDLGPKGTWYRVRIGGLENETQAQTMLDEIRKNYKSGFIVKPKQI